MRRGKATERIINFVPFGGDLSPNQASPADKIRMADSARFFPC